MTTVHAPPPKKGTGKVRVLLLGNGVTAFAALRSLAGSCGVVAVLRDAETADDPVRALAASLRIPVWGTDILRELPNLIARFKIEAVVISSFNRILSSETLALSHFINVHYSPLPRYRGRANVNWAIINGEPSAAITIHLVSPGLDDGNILFQEEVAITATDTVQSLYERLNVIQERELGAAVIRAMTGDPGYPQDHALATYGCARIPDDGEIDWTRPTATIDRLIRGLSSPFPGAFTYFEGYRLVIARAEPRIAAPRYEGRIPGRVVGRSRNEGWVDVLTGDGILRLFEVISDSTQIQQAATIIRSTRASLGLSHLHLLRRIECLERRLSGMEAAMTQGLAQIAAGSLS